MSDTDIEFYTLARENGQSVIRKNDLAENEMPVAIDSAMFFNLLDGVERWGFPKISNILEILANDENAGISIKVERKSLTFNL